jgi:hypothetical protein
MYNTVLVGSVGEVASRLLLGELLNLCYSLLPLPLNEFRDALKSRSHSIHVI